MCLWLVHVDVWLKPTQYCRVIYPTIKNDFLKKDIQILSGSFCRGREHERGNRIEDKY